VCDTTDAAFRMLARDGLLPPSIVPSFDIATADFAIVHHEHHFAEVDHQIWTVYGTTRPVHVLTYDGVPIISVYENPRRRR
jgi:DNA gyrase inhibitor GyrI